MNNSKRLKFLFGVHSHQPVGNFNHVFSESFNHCYLPFIDLVERFPKIRISLHYTGPLLEWIEKTNPAFLERLAVLVKNGQVEMLSGGFYEPLISIIPPDDAIGQIRMQNEFIQKRFGSTPQGVWLAERIWEPSIPIILSKANIDYTIVDDTHFFNAGMNQADMFNYYITERHGHLTAIFPIDKFLRYSIPFKEPQETLDYFRKIQNDYGAECITFADDGEKFGVWPGTYDWVYKEKWLERFFTLIEQNTDWIEMVPFGEYKDRYSPGGRVYIPMSSYEEMMEWALPTASAEKFHAALEWLDSAGKREEFKPFISGGFWDNFLVKYPESNLIHKKMLMISKKITNKSVPKSVRNAATKELYKGQCNCAYWHGMFGGLYLNYLRHALYEHLIQAEKIIDSHLHNKQDWITFEEVDYDADTKKEILVGTSFLNVYIDPDYGGSLAEIDYKPKNFNILNVLSRKKELYHQKLLEHSHNEEERDEGQPKSIHDIVKTKSAGLEQMLFYDTYLKRSFLDHFFEEETTVDDFHRCDYNELGDFIDSAYDYTVDKKGNTVHMQRVGVVSIRQKKRPIEIRKSILFYTDRSSLSTSYEIINKGEEELTLSFGIEFNFTLLAGDNAERYYHIPGSNFGQKNLISKGTVANSKIFCLRDDYNTFDIILKLDSPSPIWYSPIETVSQSEDGIEKTYQGSTIVPYYQFQLKKNAIKKIKIDIDIS